MDQYFTLHKHTVYVSVLIVAITCCKWDLYQMWRK